MEIDYLIIGQGIAGSLLSYELLQRNQRILVMDGPIADRSASMAAGAVLYPQAGRKKTVSALRQAAIQQAVHTYSCMSAMAGKHFCTPLSLIDCGINANTNKAGEKIIDSENVNRFFNTQEVTSTQGVFSVDGPAFLQWWRTYLCNQNLFVEALFLEEECVFHETGIIYGEVSARNIIFCRGAAEQRSPAFSSLPFTSNRGDYLLLAIPGLPDNAIYQGEVRLIPKGAQLFWCGSNYIWKYDDLTPSATWRRQTEDYLDKWLRVPYTVVAHKAAERPTTAGQFPLMGFHPRIPHYAIFNGLGTKGFSEGPVLAQIFAEYLCTGKSMINYDSGRFANFFT
jgi:glycine/D-amino acid oxidase-like deaminating enzyme